MLTPEQVRGFYDRFGARQDAQGFYEDAALERLLRASHLETARSILEFGCGTGRLAAQILTEHPAVTYHGLDVSTTMVSLAQDRLRQWTDRATVSRVEPGTVDLPGQVDRILSTYVLDLLSPAEIERFLHAAHRALNPAGKLCLVSLTTGPWVLPRLVSAGWTALWRARPQIVGGCRPVQLREHLDQHTWKIETQSQVTRWGITSEILVACATPVNGETLS